MYGPVDRIVCLPSIVACWLKGLGLGLGLGFGPGNALVVFFFCFLWYYTCGEYLRLQWYGKCATDYLWIFNR